MKVIITGTMDQLIVTSFLLYYLWDSNNYDIFKGLIFMFCRKVMIQR